ncbi:unnamed protein product [Ranitomeya imitator]|uniref:Transposase Tc1-like domain-containing protein n=1 Tax=Ranitomeya imitator TaxID=111125 RepID=A0ABN9KZ82_9NEOB|nr:unnamed protein product [Ranitomeya imitator]
MEKRKKTKELSEDFRNQIVRKHEQSQGYKSIAKDLNVPVSTVRSVIKKFKAHGTVANLPRCGRKRKMDKRFQHKIVQKLDKEPRLTSKQVQVALQSEGTTVSTRTIRRRLNEKGLYEHLPASSGPSSWLPQVPIPRESVAIYPKCQSWCSTWFTSFASPWITVSYAAVYLRPDWGYGAHTAVYYVGCVRYRVAAIYYIGCVIYSMGCAIYYVATVIYCVGSVIYYVAATYCLGCAIYYVASVIYCVACVIYYVACVIYCVAAIYCVGCVI